MADATIAVLTDSTAAHLEAYLAGLRDSPEVAGVVVADPSGASDWLGSSDSTRGYWSKSAPRWRW